MGVFGFFDSPHPVNDSDLVTEALTFFHNKMLINYPDVYHETIDTLKKKVGGASYQSFVEGFALSINSIDLSTSQLQDAMESLADASGGGIPRQTKFFTALKNRAQTITPGDWITDVIPSVAVDSAADIAAGAQEIGNAVIDTGKSLLVLGPIVIVGALLFIVYARTRQIAGR
jgi:hypothetical protein